jgi:hypothetical protein
MSIMNNQKNANKSSGHDQHENNKDRTGKNSFGNGQKNGQSGHKDDQKPMKKQSTPDRYDEDEEPVTEADLDPGKQIQIDDDPEQTRRKIPNMDSDMKKESGKSMGKGMEKSLEKGKRG